MWKGGVMDFTPKETNHSFDKPENIASLDMKPFMHCNSLDWDEIFLFSGLSFILNIALLYSHIFGSTVF